MGAALANMTGMALISDNFSVSMINFGQPRVGDTTYYKFSDSKFPNQSRITHYRDPVPQVPLKDLMDYHHTATEFYEDEFGKVNKCDGSGEDPKCNDQWHKW